ncbi:hypothetical protein [Vibrio parahaemolyticus]|uniref:hypothetical protein n=1 Tax=Vibrio parahaemolyticus TaxID=670 RepID=UPI00133133C8|nr:hypothetical protein [Vibrio parahaemolyticus]MBY3757762.1 hypothetical protein [Vibrio parahaemolyticus]MBY3772426.1 hypothetical protein [Vibrio parahaemolyticus]
MVPVANSLDVFDDYAGSRLVFFSTIWMLFTMYVINELTEEITPMPREQKFTLAIAFGGALACMFSLIGIQDQDLKINDFNNIFTAVIVILDLLLLILSLRSAKKKEDTLAAFAVLIGVWFVGARFFLTSVTGH